MSRQLIKVILISSISIALLALVLISENEAPNIPQSKSSNIKIDSSSNIKKEDEPSRKTVLPSQNSPVSHVADTLPTNLPKSNSDEETEYKKEDFIDKFTTVFVADGYSQHEIEISLEILKLAYTNRNPEGSVNLISAVDKISEALSMDANRKSRLNELLLDSLALDNRLTLDEHATCIRRRAKAFPDCVQSEIEDYIKLAAENSPDHYLRYNQVTVDLTEKFVETLSKICSQPMEISQNLLNLDIKRCD